MNSDSSMCLSRCISQSLSLVSRKISDASVFVSIYDLVVHLLQFVGVLQDRLLLGAKQPGPVHGAVGELFPPDVDQEKLDHFPLDECEILGECRWVELDLIVLLGLVDGVSRGVEHGNDGHEEEDKDDLSYYDD